jgi:hypothetical protein
MKGQYELKPSKDSRPGRTISARSIAARFSRSNAASMSRTSGLPSEAA